jgi:hypothetical protein
METEIRKDSYRASRAFTLLIFASLLRLCILASFLHHLPQTRIENVVGQLAGVAFCVAIMRDRSAHPTRRRACRTRPMRSSGMRLLALERH